MKKNEGKILVNGSVGLDMIFSINNSIKDCISISNGVLMKQNMMFTAGSKKEFFGGTGGNIAYGLGLLGAKPLLFSSVGKDFVIDYKKHLEDVGVNLRTHIETQDFTANFYGITDPIQEQIGIWQPNSYSKIDSIKLSELISKDDFKDISIAIFSPGTPNSILSHLNEFKKYSKSNAFVIFDPGQVVSFFTKTQLLECLDLSDLFIANETEFLYAEKIIGEDMKDYLISKTKKYIETKGKDGSEVYWDKIKLQISVIKPEKVIEPTGAGDAYRAGLIFGLWNGMKINEACLLGAKVASKKMEYHGGQEYKLEN